MITDKTAIFIDGAFFIKRALRIFGPLDPHALSDKLWKHSLYHLYPRTYESSRNNNTKQARDSDFHYALNHLYRIFFYDCPPLQKKMHHPLTKKSIDFSKSEKSLWRLQFHEALREKRKVALRMGTMDDKIYRGLSYLLRSKSCITEKFLLTI